MIAIVRCQQDFHARFAGQVFEQDVTDGNQKVSQDKDFAGYSHNLGSSKKHLFFFFLISKVSFIQNAQRGATLTKIYTNPTTYTKGTYVRTLLSSVAH